MRIVEQTSVSQNISSDRFQSNGMSAPGSFPAWLIILIAALVGLIYLFLVPPWQHYDEPGHFEYVWLIARLGRPPLHSGSKC